jgi:hypothetical protein
VPALQHLATALQDLKLFFVGPKVEGDEEPPFAFRHLGNVEPLVGAGHWVLPAHPVAGYPGQLSHRRRDYEADWRAPQVRVVERRSGRLSGAQALARLQELKGQLQDAQLKAAGLV